MDIDEDGGIQDGYQLKLNSYDLGVDIELNDALNRIRFEHPNVQCVVFKSGKNKMFCSGANIYMLGQSIHAWKVNFVNLLTKQEMVLKIQVKEKI